MLEEAERSLHDALCVVDATVKVSYSVVEICHSGRV